jgi:hypothetical protein
MAFKFWRLRMTGDVRSTGLAGFNNRLHSDRFPPLRGSKPAREPSVSERARASSRGGVWRKPNAKWRGDEQKLDIRCDALGASWHVTAKPSIRKWGAFYKSSVYAMKV